MKKIKRVIALMCMFSMCFADISTVYAADLSPETSLEAGTYSENETEKSNSTEEPAESSSEQESTAPEIHLSQPVLVSASSLSYNKVQIKWNAVEEADGYYVYRKSGSSWEKIAETKELSYNDSNLTCGTKYIYTVSAFKKNGEECVLSSYDETGIFVTPVPSAPVLKNVSASTSALTVTWDKVDGADSYIVYRKTSDSSWKNIANVTGTSYKDTDVSLKVTYTYTVKAVCNKTESSYDKNGVSGTLTLTAPAQPELKSAASSSYNSVTIKWNAVKNAEGYCVYRKQSDGKWKKLKDVTSTSYTDTGLTCGTKYTYTIRAFIKDGSKYLLSDYNSNGISATPVPSAPALKSTQSASSSVTVNWGSVSGATTYYVYRKKPGESWKKIASVTGTSYKDTSAAKGTKYIYTVKSIRNKIAGKYNSSGIEGALLIPAVSMKSVSVSSGGTASLKWSSQSGADGYYIYRKENNGSWKQVGKASKTSWSEKGLKSSINYSYTVAGYKILNKKEVKGSMNNTGIAPKLEYTGKFVRNVTKTYLGTSGAGRKMYSYTIGSGKNHIVITMAVHGWEDNWSKDASLLVKTGEQLITYASQNTSTLKSKDYSIIIVPCGNPDGLYSGTTCYGPGRCTTYRYNDSGQLVKGGVDLNRCFPAGFKALYNNRNYTGSKPLMAKEARVLKNFVDSNKGSGKNIFIDGHGWLNQTITHTSGSGKVYQAFKKYFPGTRPASFGKGLGYISGYAYSKGYEAVLFEFPNVTSSSQFDSQGYANKFINTVFYMVKNIR